MKLDLLYTTKELIFLIFLIFINLLGFILFAIDKSKAKKDLWRISEATLLIVAFLGGAVGGLIGMVIFKHKLSKKTFSLGIPLLIILNRLVEIFIFSYIRLK